MACNILVFGLIAVALLAVSASAQTKDGLPVVYGYMTGQRCPAPRFYNDCNRCACSSEGYSAACTRMGCPDTPKIGTVQSKPRYAPDYQPGDMCPAKYFYDGCNNCVCGKDGYAAACTLKACMSDYN